MNKLFRNAGLTCLGFLGLCLAVATFSPPADAQVGPPALGGSYTPFSNTLPALGNITNAVKRPIDVPAKSVVVFFLTIGGQNIGTSNIVFSFNGSLDGQNWTTTFPFSMTGATAGTNAYKQILILGTNLPARFISLDSISSTSTNAISVSNVTYVFFPS
jgi:hypothetical protein